MWPQELEASRNVGKVALGGGEKAGRAQQRVTVSLNEREKLDADNGSLRLQMVLLD
jgi:hypothetical protein